MTVLGQRLYFFEALQLASAVVPRAAFALRGREAMAALPGAKALDADPGEFGDGTDPVELGFAQGRSESGQGDRIVQKDVRVSSTTPKWIIAVEIRMAW